MARARRQPAELSVTKKEIGATENLVKKITNLIALR